MSDTVDLPVVDLAPLLAVLGGSGDVLLANTVLVEEARRAADALHQYGLLCVRDPRAEVGVTNDEFLNMLEAYFDQAEEEKEKDVRQDIWYQLGRTPSRVELPRNHCARMSTLGAEDKPLSLCPPEADAKERFFWRPSGASLPPDTAFPQLNAPPVLPAAFPQWAATMDGWGNKLMDAAFAVATLAAVGFGMEPTAFTSRMAHGPHLLAPTASDFTKFGVLGTVLAGYHYDLNFITAHGRSRYPGLAVWTRDGRKMWAKVPSGCLLIQAGKQFEHLTAGHVLAGFHEVVVNASTVEAIQAARAEGRSLWRISSTLFGHIASDVTLAPLPPFQVVEGGEGYPPILAGDFVAAELAAINLGEGSKGIADAR